MNMGYEETFSQCGVAIRRLIQTPVRQKTISLIPALLHPHMPAPSRKGLSVFDITLTLSAFQQRQIIVAMGPSQFSKPDIN